MNIKKYLKLLFSLVAFISLIAVGYIYYFNAHYPLPLTSRISLDAKLKFIRDEMNPNNVDTIIVGSSLGLNNVQGSVLEKESSTIKRAVNLSVYGARATQVEQLLELASAFPNLKRIIYSTQYSDFSHAHLYQDYNSKRLSQYIRNELNIFQELFTNLKACNNLFFCIQRQLDWETKHMQNNMFEYLGFDATGSVPLNIYDDDIVSHRWRLAQPNVQHPKSFEAVNRMSEKAYREGVKFYLIQTPYRAPLAKKHKYVVEAINTFIRKNKNIVESNNGYFYSLHYELNLDDSYFADRSHLNDKGSKIVAEKIADLIDQNEKTN